MEEHRTTEGVDLGCMSAVGIKDKVVQMLLFADNCRVFLLQVTPDFSTIADRELNGNKSKSTFADCVTAQGEHRGQLMSYK